MRPLLAFALLGSLVIGLPEPSRALQPASSAQPATVLPAESAVRLVARLRHLDEDGLDPAAYTIPPLSLLATDPASFRQRAQQAAAAALDDLLHGRLRELPAGRADLRRDPAAQPLGPWLAELARSPDPAAVIDRAALLPRDAGPIRAELARLRARLAAGPLPALPAGPALQPGAEDPVRVPILRSRLAADDPALAEAAEPGTVYDAVLEAAVRRFQATEGIEPDGVVGAGTVAALNRSPAVKIRQLRVALDMRRAAAPEPAERRVEVNIPDFRARLVESGRVLLDMGVIVGRPSRQTPTMRARITAAVLNPQWGVPVHLAREDLLPRFRRDAKAMREQGFRVYAYRDGEAQEIDPTTVNWARVDPEHFPYTIRQAAGDDNALGRVKLVMPNNQDIYLHDTPERSLFRRAERAFSSGCVRMERPVDMAEMVLAGTPGWNHARVQQVLDSRATTTVALSQAVPVRLYYSTVVVEGNVVRVRPDVYGLDDAYAQALDAVRPRASVTAALH